MNQKQIPILRPGDRLSYIRQQIDAIQNIALPIGSWLLAASANNSLNDAEAYKRHPISGEAVVAAELLFCKACDKLGTILDDPKFLSTDDHEVAESATIDMMKENTRLIQQQRIGLEWSNSPAARFEPLLVRLEENFWSAVLGDLTNHSNMVCGVGPSPEAALKNFNLVFEGKVSEPLMLYAQIREKALTQDPDSAPPPVFDGTQTPPDNKP